MDPPSFPRLGRRARYDSFPLIPYFPDPIIDRHVHPPYAPPASQPAVPPPSFFSRNHYQEPTNDFGNPSGNDFDIPSPHCPNPTGFDSHNLPFPNFSDRPLYDVVFPRENTLLSENWKRSRRGGGAVDEHGVFYEKLFKVGDPNGERRTRRRLESEQGRLLWKNSDWQRSFWSEQQSRCHDPFEQLPLESTSMAAEPPPLSSPSVLRSSCSGYSRRGDDSSAFVHRPHISPFSSGRSSTDLYVFNSTATMSANSQVIENGVGLQRGQSFCKKKNYGRDLPFDRGFGGRRYMDHTAIRDSDSIIIADKDGFLSSHDMVRKRHSIPIPDYEPKFEEDCSIGNKGKMKMFDDRNAKYYKRFDKRPVQKPSAFSRIQSGLSVWDRLEEKPLIITSTSSLPSPLSPAPMISNNTETKVDILDFPIKPNDLVSKAMDPLIIEPSLIKVNLHVEKPNRIRKKKKKMPLTRGKMESHVIVVSADSSEQKVGKISNVHSNGSLSVHTKVKKVDTSSSIHGNELFNKKKVKKLPVVKMNGAKEVPMIVGSVETPKFEGIIYAKETNGCTHNDDTGGKIINDCVIETFNDTGAQSSVNNVANSSTHEDLEGTGSIKQDKLPVNVSSPEKQGAGEIVVLADSRTISYISDSPNCNSTVIVKELENMESFTAIKESEVSGNCFSSELYLYGLQIPSFSEISNAPANQSLPSERTIKENNEFNLSSFNMLPQSGCTMISQDSLSAPRIDANGPKVEEALLLEPTEMDSASSLFVDASPSHPQYSEDIEFTSNEPSSNKVRKDKSNSENFARTMTSSSVESVHESCKTVKNHKIISEKTRVLPYHEINKQLFPNAKVTAKKFTCKTVPQYEVPRFLSNPQKQKAARTCQPGRHRTWLRTNTLLHSDENQKRGLTSSNISPKKLGKIQTSSYIRKGNSLIRKLDVQPAAVLPVVSPDITKLKTIPERGSVTESFGDVPNNATPSYPLFERPKTPPLPPPSKFLDCTITSCYDFPQLRQVDMSPESETDEGNLHDGQSKVLPSGNFGSQDTPSLKRDETVIPKSVTYVKRKKNQLVAAPDPEYGDSSKFLAERFTIPAHHPTERSKTLPFSSSYLYYRSKRNQLIRSASSSDRQTACDTNSVDSIQRRNTRSFKRIDVHRKAKKPTISSLVWTLNGDKLSHKNIATLGCQRIFPNLFPWKRAVNWKSFIMNDRVPNSSRFSLISQKLQCLRKRGTIYKVSTDGFSLRKAGVVSIGGSNLKWSKSIEKRSKKASEEATLAVAEMERNKRERKKSKSTCRNGKNKFGLTGKSACGSGLKRGERIFRVGSARYKMDSSKRTLIKIPDVISSSPKSQQQGNNSQKSFVPRRLIIGNNEYVRIGNGNQLVRDPKKLQRILASEKIRWSLHTARLKLAQKHQYCLFFTRFGKCYKYGGKCPYIHDSSKVAICTKFLKSKCSDSNCKLTHKVIPERMPDCSYFLIGLCTNINCPYRHVKVNVNAPLCDGFLRGHCADGDECRKKHSYTCPLFEATGKCPQGSLCKLRHPKSQNKSIKRKRTKLKSSGHGRYFYSSIGKADEPLKVACSQNDFEELNDIFCSDGRYAEYIDLDTDTDNTGVENNVLMDSGKSDSGYFDMQSCDIDALIKPFQIMNSDDLTIF